MIWTNSLKHKLSKVTQEETENINCPIDITEIEFLVKQNKTPYLQRRPRWLHQEVLPTFKADIILFLHKLFQKIRKGVDILFYILRQKTHNIKT